LLAKAKWKNPAVWFYVSQIAYHRQPSQPESKFNTVKNSIEALDAGKSLVIFPEGELRLTTLPTSAGSKTGLPGGQLRNKFLLFLSPLPTIG